MNSHKLRTCLYLSSKLNACFGNKRIFLRKTSCWSYQGVFMLLIKAPLGRLQWGCSSKQRHAGFSSWTLLLPGRKTSFLLGQARMTSLHHWWTLELHKDLCQQESPPPQQERRADLYACYLLRPASRGQHKTNFGWSWKTGLTGMEDQQEIPELEARPGGWKKVMTTPFPGLLKWIGARVQLESGVFISHLYWIWFLIYCIWFLIFDLILSLYFIFHLYFIFNFFDLILSFMFCFIFHLYRTHILFHF